jgi:malate synthase
MSTPSTSANAVRLLIAPTARQAEVVSPAALAFLAELERRFGPRRRELLAARIARQARLDAGEKPNFLSSTADIRAAAWKVAPPAPDLIDRRVEITGPVDRKMVINALNSGANVFMADFEDSNSPTFQNCLDGQVNLRDAVRREIVYTQPETKKRYELNAKPATLVVRPRGWHLEETNLRIDGQPMSAALFDFGLYFFHNAAESVKRGFGPYFYLPKMESHLEARLWNDVFVWAQQHVGLPRGTVRATVLIETILASFEMEEILYELKEHSSGLNCGRWDYIFSFIKKFQARPEAVFPDRGTVGMDRHFLRSYSQLLIQTCHRRGAHAMGGMAAQIPIKDNPAQNQVALDKVRADKRREATEGHDGTWVAHPGLVAIAKEEFDRVMTGPNQLHVLREDVDVRAQDLLSMPEGQITEAGLRANLEVGMTYLEAWLCGTGCVPIHHLMEDAATAEISRTQVWAWLRHGARLADGRKLTPELFAQVLKEELARIEKQLGPERFKQSRFKLAAELFDQLIRAERCPDFLTLAAYPHLEHGAA